MTLFCSLCGEEFEESWETFEYSTLSSPECEQCIHINYLMYPDFPKVDTLVNCCRCSKTFTESLFEGEGKEDLICDECSKELANQFLIKES